LHSAKAFAYYIFTDATFIIIFLTMSFLSCLFVWNYLNFCSSCSVQHGIFQESRTLISWNWISTASRIPPLHDFEGISLGLLHAHIFDSWTHSSLSSDTVLYRCNNKKQFWRKPSTFDVIHHNSISLILIGLQDDAKIHQI
jgi:hypothetical protein